MYKKKLLSNDSYFLSPDSLFSRFRSLNVHTFIVALSNNCYESI